MNIYWQQDYLLVQKAFSDTQGFRFARVEKDYLSYLIFRELFLRFKLMIFRSQKKAYSSSLTGTKLLVIIYNNQCQKA